MTTESNQTSVTKAGSGVNRVLIAVYYMMLLVMLVASLFPAYRVWGFNHWAYYPGNIVIALFSIGVVLPFVVGRWSSPPGVERSGETGPGGKFLLAVSMLIVVNIALFYLLRARTHFLGDGYLILSNLPDVNPWVKVRNLGEELIHKGVYLLLSGSGWSRSLLAYQLVSYASGVIVLISAAFASARLFSRFSDRMIFFLGLVSSGYMLLFFGYVENYSVFVTSVIVFTLLGLLVLTGRINRWYVLIPMFAALVTHAFGMVLIPSALFLLMSGGTLEEKLLRLSTTTKILLISVGVAICGAAFLYFYNTNYFFRFSVVPLVENRFTVEGYTLFSVKHFLDMVNLVFLLLPGFLLLLVVTVLVPVRNLFAMRENTFLLILTLSALGAVFLFDPKLGMPRDWDLFSFCGVPLAVWGYYIVVRNRSLSGLLNKAAVLAIFLGFVILIPRAVGRTRGEIELHQVKNYTRLDVKKTNSLAWLIRDHYFQRGDTATAWVLYQQWLKDFPEHELNEKGKQAKNEGRFYDAIEYFRAAIETNPIFSPSYHALATCYTQVGLYDSALAMFAISDGMNPNSPPSIIELARLYRAQSRMAEAEKYFRRALTIDPQNMDASLGLLELYWTTEQLDKHSEFLIKVAAYAKAPSSIHVRLGDYYFSNGAFDLAEEQYRLAVDKGMDSTLLGEKLKELNDLKK